MRQKPGAIKFIVYQWRIHNKFKMSFLECNLEVGIHKIPNIWIL